MLHESSCYLIDNITTPHSEDVALNGTQLESDMNFVSYNDTGVTINGKGIRPSSREGRR